MCSINRCLNTYFCSVFTVRVLITSVSSEVTTSLYTQNSICIAHALDWDVWFRDRILWFTTLLNFYAGAAEIWPVAAGGELSSQCLGDYVYENLLSFTFKRTIFACLGRNSTTFFFEIIILDFWNRTPLKEQSRHRIFLHTPAFRHS